MTLDSGTYHTMIYDVMLLVRFLPVNHLINYTTKLYIIIMF